MEDIACILLLVSKTRFEEANVQTTFSNRKFCQAHQIGQIYIKLQIAKNSLDRSAGSDELHSVSYITEKGDKIWIKMDASRPCKFNTTETRWDQSNGMLHDRNFHNILQVLQTQAPYSGLLILSKLWDCVCNVSPNIITFLIWLFYKMTA